MFTINYFLTSREFAIAWTPLRGDEWRAHYPSKCDTVRHRHILLFHLNQAVRPLLFHVVAVEKKNILRIIGKICWDISHFVGVTLTKESVGLIKKCERSQLCSGGRVSDELSDKKFERSMCARNTTGFPWSQNSVSLYILLLQLLSVAGR